MTQHINLLQLRRRPVGTALAALATVAVLLLCLLTYGLVLQSQSKDLRAQLGVSAQGLQETKMALAALRARASANSSNKAGPSAMQAEIDALKSQLLQRKKWGELAGNHSLGNPAGYLEHFQTLSGVSEEGLWLTSIFVSDSGKLVNLTGRALRNDSVLRYAEKLNQAFAPQGVQFNAIEMTPEAFKPSGQEGAPALRSVSFRLF
jgi:hypothetical protein